MSTYHLFLYHIKIHSMTFSQSENFFTEILWLVLEQIYYNAIVRGSNSVYPGEIQYLLYMQVAETKMSSWNVQYYYFALSKISKYSNEANIYIYILILTISAS